MSILFEPLQVGNLELKNRFVRSAACESSATERGEATDDLVERYGRLARGEVGLIITGHMYVHPLGQCFKYQTGIYSDALIPGLKQVTDAVHKEGGKVAFQLAHGGVNANRSLIGQTPVGPSNRPRDSLTFLRPKRMTEVQIQEAIEAFRQAARRAVEAGADGVQIHAAHGYLVSQYLSSYYNDREDDWGASDEKRFRLLRRVYLAIRKELPGGMPLLVKMNVHDHTPEEGVTPPLAAKYASWLVELGIDGVELSCGTPSPVPWNMIRGDVPVYELVRSFAWWQKPVVRMILSSAVGKYDVEEAYNLEAAKAVRPVLDGVPLAVVGGMRTVSRMEQILEQGQADLLSLARPLIREPYLVKQIREGKTEKAACQSCNRCLAALQNDMVVRCYCKGLPA
jgi:2,4-dienoyl-CoA reductase-like NADH-dependent reductase (Old Yellow Enzyme family)